MIYTEKQLIKEIKKQIGRMTVTDFAKKHKINRCSLSSALSGNRELSNEIIKTLGFETVYVKKAKND